MLVTNQIQIRCELILTRGSNFPPNWDCFRLYNLLEANRSQVLSSQLTPGSLLALEFMPLQRAAGERCSEESRQMTVFNTGKTANQARESKHPESFIFLWFPQLIGCAYEQFDMKILVRSNWRAIFKKDAPVSQLKKFRRTVWTGAYMPSIPTPWPLTAETILQASTRAQQRMGGPKSIVL